jgi:hypothetical protein
MAKKTRKKKDQSSPRGARFVSKRRGVADGLHCMTVTLATTTMGREQVVPGEIQHVCTYLSFDKL